MVGPPEFYASCDERLAHMVTWSRYRGQTYATVVLKATLSLYNGRGASLFPPQSIRWCDHPRASGAIDRADESAPFTGGGAVLVHGFFYAQNATERDPAMARVVVGAGQPVVDKVIGAERSGRIPLHWEQARRTLDNPVGAEHPALINPHDRSRSIGLGPIAPGWPTRANLLFAPINVHDQILELPERLDSRFFNPAPRDQQCQPFKGNEGIVLLNLVPNIPEFRTFLPSLSVHAKVMVNGAPVQAIFFLDTITIDAEAMQAHLLWRAVTPLRPDTRHVAVEATVSGSFEMPDVPEEPVSVAPETTPAGHPVAPGPAIKPPRILPTEPRQLTRLDNPRRALMERVAAGQSLENLDLSSADLQGIDLCDRSLAGSKLDGANLKGAKLRGANLWAASLVGADLSSAWLDGADLESANLSTARAQKASLIKATLSKANLVKARFDGANLDDADLTDCDAAGVAFMGAKLRRAKMNRAKMTGALLVKADFTDAGLDFAQLDKCSMDDANFAGASLADADMTKSIADRANFDKARLARANMTQTRFTSASLSGADFGSAVLERADLTSAHLDGVLLDRANAQNAKFVRADMTGASLQGTDLRGADLTEARMTNADRSTANLEGAKLAGIID